MPTKKPTSRKSASKKFPVKNSPAKNSGAKSSGAKSPARPASGRKPIAAQNAAPARLAGAAAAPAATGPVAATATAGQETVEAVMKAGSQAASKGYEQAIALAQEQVEKASETLFKGYDEAASYGQDNVDAYVLSTTVFARGVESLGQELMSLVQSTVEANLATAKALFGATSVQELVELQTEFSRSRFSALVAESAKLTELGMTVTGEAIEPIQARLNATVERLIKPVAA